MDIKTHHAVFSQAIREGAKIRPQRFLALIADRRTCAIGAGLEAMGSVSGDYDLMGFSCLDDGGITDQDLYAVYPYLEKTIVRCPRACHKDSLFKLIVHLNDGHRWTREAIADWLETEEEKLGYVLVIDTQETNTAKPEQPSPIEQHSALSSLTR